MKPSMEIKTKQFQHKKPQDSAKTHSGLDVEDVFGDGFKVEGSISHKDHLVGGVVVAVEEGDGDTVVFRTVPRRDDVVDAHVGR